MEDMNFEELGLGGDMLGNISGFFDSGGDELSPDVPEPSPEEYFPDNEPPVPENEPTMPQNEPTPQPAAAPMMQRNVNPGQVVPIVYQQTANQRPPPYRRPAGPVPAVNPQTYQQPAVPVPAVNPQPHWQQAGQNPAVPQQHNRVPARPVQAAQVRPQIVPRPAEQYPPPGTAVWNTDLFSCFDDIPLCCLTCWCPCIVFGRIAEIVDKGAIMFTTSSIIYAAMLGVGFQFVYSCSYRNKMRLQYGIVGDDFEDYCIHMWCESCALSQEYKELTARGYNPPLGWHVNMAMQKQAQEQGMQMAPRAPPGMTR